MSREIEIMRLVIMNSQQVRKLTLSNRAVELFNFCKTEKGAMTYQVAKKFNISIQGASTQLQKLWLLGYLTRTELTAKSGGIEHVYYPFE